MASSAPPGLTLVTTPIGNARDITLRALDVLRDADVLVAEDTRSLKRLLSLHGIAVGERPLFAYHDHSGPRERARILNHLSAGDSVAYASEAGTPMIADPGYALVQAAREADHPVTAAPGVSAVITALSTAGLPTDQFHFCGFLPAAQGARRRALEGLATLPGTLAIYESPKRLARTLSEAAEILGGDRAAAVCRELTKKFEEVRRGTLAQLAEDLAGAPVKGEVVVLLGPAVEQPASDADVEAALREALERLSTKEAAAEVAAGLGVPRRDVYQRALRMLGKG